MSYTRKDGMSDESGAHTPDSFGYAHHQHAGEQFGQARLAVLFVLDRDAVTGEAGPEVAAAMVEWPQQLPDSPRYPREQI